jgi:transposase
MCVFVRDLTRSESQRLSRILKTTSDCVLLRRAQVVAFSGQGMRAKAVGEQLHLHEEYVRELIRRFNTGSFKALEPRKRTGRPRELEPEEIALILEFATSRPKDVGLPFTTWSLRKLTTFLLARKVVRKISPNMLGRVLDENGISFQRTKTWKESNDPEFDLKKSGSSGSTRRSPRARK